MGIFSLLGIKFSSLSVHTEVYVNVLKTFTQTCPMEKKGLMILMMNLKNKQSSIFRCQKQVTNVKRIRNKELIVFDRFSTIFSRLTFRQMNSSR